MPATRTWHVSLALVVFLLLGVSVVAAGAWRLSGGQIYVMETPSMSPVTPVGSLVLDRTPTHLRVGDTITFRVNATGPLYTHRLVAIRPGGRYKTQGWAESERDTWVLHRSEIVGKTIAQVRDLGWLYKVLPLWCIAAALYLLVRRLLPRQLRYGVACLWGVVVVAVPMVLWHPLIDATQIGYKRSPGGHDILLRVASTGLLPLKIWATGGKPVLLRPGGITWAPTPVHQEAVTLHKIVALPAWGWALVGVLILGPLLGYFVSRWWSRASTDAASEQEPIASRVLAPLPSAAPVFSASARAGAPRAPASYERGGTPTVLSRARMEVLLPTPQWYPDPYGVPDVLRYWDGSNWTTYVARASFRTDGATRHLAG